MPNPDCVTMKAPPVQRVQSTQSGLNLFYYFNHSAKENCSYPCRIANARSVAFFPLQSLLLLPSVIHSALLQEMTWWKTNLARVVLRGNPYISHLGLFSTITRNTFWFQINERIPKDLLNSLPLWCFAVNVKCNHFLNSAFHSYIQPWFLQPQGWWCLIVVNKKWLVLLGSCNRSTVLYFFNSCWFIRITPEEWEILYV